MGALRRFGNYLDLAWAYVRLNMRAQLEYRGAFVSQVAAMFVNDCVWVVFWALFFTRFPVLRGWDVADVITVWAVAAAGFGLAHALYGNVLALATIIAKGEIDVWMLYPRALLPHMLLGKMNATAWGDALFGFVVYVAFVRPDAPRLALFVLLAVASGAVFVGFGILSGSIGFYLGNSATLTEQWRFAMLTFSTYPATLFQGGVKLLLYTAIPAFFVNLYPVEALRSLSLADAGLAVLGAIGTVAVGTAVFYHGLRRYESGNLLAMRE
jgi:ABC-2 type transport system permease protein